MKIRIKFLPVFYAWTMAMASIGMIVGCTKTERIKIGVSQCSYDDWRMKLNEELYRESLLHDDLDLTILSAYDDPDRQVKDIRQFIDDGVDVIITSPQNSTNLNEVLAEARSKGIKVIDFDRKPSVECYDIYIGADNNQLGHSAGNYLLDRLPEGSRLIEIHGLVTSTPAEERSAGFRKSLNEHPGARLIATAYGDWDTDKAERVTDSLLRLYPDIDAIFAHNDRMAIGAAEAARKLGRDSLMIAGIDAVPQTGINAVAKGNIDVTFMYPTAGKELLELGLKAAKGQKLSDEFIISSTQPIDKSNASILLELSQSIDNEKDRVGFLKQRVDEFSSRHNMQNYVIGGITILVLLLAGGLFLILRAYWGRKRAQAELAMRNDQLSRQRDELESLNRQLEDATRSKLTFFTNVSHDLRTPLTLIAEPISSLSKATNLTNEQHTLVELADKNVLILRRLINQILDFRKFESGRLETDLHEINPESALQEWAEAFRALARRRHIDYSINLGPFESKTLAVDPNKLERIIFNIMSNAFKFTPDNGRISLTASSTMSEFSIVISDSGKGIAADELPHVFERFYQAGRVLPQGSGIGLALVKAFTELHGGTVTAESEPGKGTVFRVTIPVRHVAESQIPASETAGTISSENLSISNREQEVGQSGIIDRELGEVEEVIDPESLDADKPTLLIIDDTSDIRILLRTLLGDEYNIIEGADGKQGIRLASKYIPDLIICDMMMPGMDGMECCRRIKEETSTSHIPILMLTACRLDEQRADAYEAGADGFVSKPFSNDVLRSRCRSLIANRHRIAQSEVMPGFPLTGKTASVSADAEAQAKNLPSERKQDKEIEKTEKISAAKVKSVRRNDPMVIENEFYQRFLEIVDRELGNPDISVEEIGQQLGLSRVQFYRKIKALTNFSPVELLRMRRLKEAYRMLTSTESTVAEVAYAVGFSSPGYFTKCFKEQFSELPADLQKRTSKLK